MPKDVFMGTNSARQYRKGGEIYLNTDRSITLPAKTETKVNLDWSSTVRSDTFWITLNAPISNDITVDLVPDSVIFAIIVPPK